MDTKLNIASCKETNTEQVPGMAYVPWQQFTRTYDQTKSGYAAKENEPEGTV